VIDNRNDEYDDDDDDDDGDGGDAINKHRIRKQARSRIRKVSVSNKDHNLHNLCSLQQSRMPTIYLLRICLASIPPPLSGFSK
jgi:hypothetical protein